MRTNSSERTTTDTVADLRGFHGLRESLPFEEDARGMGGTVEAEFMMVCL
jgi:hypothetical protein